MFTYWSLLTCLPIFDWESLINVGAQNASPPTTNDTSVVPTVANKKLRLLKDFYSGIGAQCEGIESTPKQC